MKRVVILSSGRWFELVAMAESAEHGYLDIEIVRLVTNVPGDRLMDNAQLFGIPAIGIPRGILSKNEHDEAMANTIMNARPDLVVMSGYLEILGPEFFKIVKCPVMNIHPSLLPEFGGKGMYGIKVFEAVLESGIKETGCTVHLVTEEVDAGRIIIQRKLPIIENETPEELAKRMVPVEVQAYIDAVHLFSQDMIVIEDGKVKMLAKIE